MKHRLWDQRIKRHDRREHAGRHEREQQQVFRKNATCQHADQSEDVENADAHGRLVRLPALLEVRILVGRDRIVSGPYAHEAEQVGQPKLFEQRHQERLLINGEVEPVPAGLQLRHVRIALGIVDELMMRDVLQAVMLRRAEQRKHAEPIGHKIVPQAIAQQDVMRCLVSEPGKLMLPRANEEDREHSDRHVQPPGPVVAGVECKGAADDQRKVEVGAREIKEIGDVVGMAKLLQLLLDARIAERHDGRRRWSGGGHSCNLVLSDLLVGLNYSSISCKQTCQGAFSRESEAQVHSGGAAAKFQAVRL